MSSHDEGDKGTLNFARIRYLTYMMSQLVLPPRRPHHSMRLTRPGCVLLCSGAEQAGAATRPSSFASRPVAVRWIALQGIRAESRKV